MRNSTPRARSGARLPATAGGATDCLGVLNDAPLHVVDLDSDDDRSSFSSQPAPRLPFVVVGLSRRDVRSPAPAGLDVALTTKPVPSEAHGWVEVGDGDETLGGLQSNVACAPEAAVVFCQVLRASGALETDDALFVESLAYSTLQSGPAFRRWLTAAARPSPRAEPGDTVLVDRDGPQLVITLNRPRVRNALNARMRDELASYMELACADPTIESVHLRGNGSAFCSGGDLSEFGTTPDPVTAHLVRTARSPASLLAALAGRTTAHLHGACVGAGIELAAFCGRVVAAPNAWIQLPELGYGLIPGAGGTVSIARRIGRQRTAWLGLTGATVAAPLAQRWGLIDLLEEPRGQ